VSDHNPHISGSAEADLREIWFYVARDNTDAADRFVDRIQKKCQLLAESPRIGRSRAELGPGLRSFPIGNYLIFYRSVHDGIEVVRILSGYRDLDALFDSGVS